MAATRADRTDAVTGAFGYTGRTIAEQLLGSGRSVRTLTNHPRLDDPLASRLVVAPLDFRRPVELAISLEGVDTLFNTYWVRFDRGGTTFDRAVVESAALFEAARRAGVRRIVHVSITNADIGSPLPYFHGKGQVERALAESGVPFSIVRPTVVVGERDILIHNISWLLRHVPVFGIAGDGRYPIQPVVVDDVARLAIEMADRRPGTTVDAVGPEVFSFEELVRLVAAAVGSRARLVHLPPTAVLAASAVLGRLLGDVVLTRDELRGLSDGLLVSDRPATGRIPLTDWLRDNRASLGATYANEVRRHYAG